MTLAPTVSIGIPTYNRAHMLRQAIRSVLQQTFQDFEIIVVDDCSPDATAEAVRDIGDLRIRYYRTARNLRPPASWNLTARLARGEFFALLPDDDVYRPTFLAEMVARLRAAPQAGFAQCGFIPVDEQLRPLRTVMPRRHAFAMHGEAALRWQLKTLSCLPVTLLFRRAAILDLGLWREHFWDDWALIMRVAYHHGFVFVPQALACNRVHASNLNRVIRAEARDPILDIVSQYDDIFGAALPTTAGLVDLRARLDRRLSRHAMLLALGALRGRQWRQAGRQIALAHSLYALAGLDPSFVLLALHGRLTAWRTRRLQAAARRRPAAVTLDAQP